jgi:membrane peptidoglycan carboxypeptidase
MLAAVIVNPRVLNPSRPSKGLLRRQQLILRRMGGAAPPSAEAGVSLPDNDAAAVDNKLEIRRADLRK